ncbi:MAG: GNAT family N-acetyltransferase [Verrucomicrobia bacterium]|nr:GNAT family N-acetyltransferase [Verrucomicrobiota bacterium]
MNSISGIEYGEEISFPFLIQEVSSSDKDFSRELIETLHLWKIIAEGKRRESPIPLEQERFSVLIDVASYFITNLKSSQGDSSLIINRKNQHIKSIAMTINEDNKLILEYLITDPRNIKTTVNSEEPDRVSGAGTSIIQYLFQKCLTEELEEIFLHSNPDAKKFYEKLGFEKINNRKTCNKMHITSEKIRTFLFSKSPPNSYQYRLL